MNDASEFTENASHDPKPDGGNLPETGLVNREAKTGDGAIDFPALPSAKESAASLAVISIASIASVALIVMVVRFVIAVNH